MTTSRTATARCCAAFVLVLAAVIPVRAGQLSWGDSSTVRVTAVDAQQLLVPGAVCTLLRPGSPTAVFATAVTDEQGIAVFQKIVSGTYTLRVEIPGFDPFVKNDVVVSGNPVTEIHATLLVSAVSQNVTVAAPQKTATSVEAGASIPAGNLERRVVQRLPLANARIEDALPLVPGVVRSSTGEISIKGASEQQSGLLINGLNASDPGNGGFRVSLPVDSVEAVQVFLHPYTAEYGQFTGGVTQVETRPGGDRWHFELNDFLPDLRFVNGKIVGIAEDAPHVNLSGPLVPHRLFLSQSGAYALANRPVRGLDFPVNETKTEAQSYFTQIDATYSYRHTQTFTAGYFPERDQFIGLDVFRPRPATPNARQRDIGLTARDNSQLGGGLLTSALSFRRFDTRVWGQGTEDHILTPTGEAGNYFATQDRSAYRVELFEVYTFPTKHFLHGSHDVKAGVDLNGTSSRLDYAARAVDITRGDGTRSERIEFDAAPRIRANNREYVGFVQDRWTIRSNLSVDLGLRYEDQRIADGQSLAPRGGVAWAPGAAGGTVIRGGIGLFFDKVPLNMRSFAQYPARTVTRFWPDGVTVTDRRRFANLLVNADPSVTDSAPSSDEVAFVPANLTWNVQLDQQIRGPLRVRANFVNSRTENIYIVNPELDTLGQNVIVLRSMGQSMYRALELTARLAPHGQMFYVSYMRSNARGDLNDFNTYFGDVAEPVIRRNQYSTLPSDVPHRLLAWGTIALPRRVTVAPIFEVRSGFPYSVRDAEQNFVGVRNADRTRFPRFAALDMEVAKEFQVTQKYAVRLSLRGFNVTNHFNPRDVHANLADPAFGQFLASYRRYFSGGFDLMF